MEYTNSKTLVRDFVSRGLIVLSPHDLGIPLEIHQEIYEREKAALQDRKYVTASLIPQILQVLDAPGVVEACNQLVGKNWAIVPFTHNTPFLSGSNDQHWHKDDNGPYNGRKQRHHDTVQVEMLYYPQDVRMDMGPTATVPYSQYWTFNHEENHDNFAGADHLDFAYQMGGMERIPISGPRSEYPLEEIAKQRTEHDIRMRKAVEDLHWPMCHQFEVGPLLAGSVVLYSHNLLHRGNHRRDDWRTWKGKPRFMWRFWLYRTTDPIKLGDQIEETEWKEHAEDSITRVSMADATRDCEVVWNYHYRWLHGEPKLRSTDRARLASVETEVARKLYEQILTKHDTGEPRRIGAAYELAALIDRNIACKYLRKALYNERESVRRAASYGLVALGEDSTDVLLEAATSPVRWIRRAAAFGIGDAGELSERSLNTLTNLLLEDSSVFVRSVAASGFGSFIRRLVNETRDLDLIQKAAISLSSSLSREENRLAMDKAQGRSIKLVRPTDDCDICEGIGIDYGQDRFKPVRSAVRENVLWSMVMLCSHGSGILGRNLGVVVDSLETVVNNDKNVFCVGFAMDALNRLVNLGTNDEKHELVELNHRIQRLVADSPIHSLEPMLRGGLSPAQVADRYEISDRMRLPFERIAPQLAKF